MVAITNMERGTETRVLQDLPVVYMTDVRAHWEDFRKALKEAGVLWGLADWITTILQGGVTWRELEARGMLEAYIKIVKAEEDEKGKDLVGAGLSDEMQRALGLTSRDREFFQVSYKFISTVTWKVEDPKRLPARSKLWNWICKALAGPNPARQEGPYHYLTTKVEQYDLAALYRELVRVIDTPTVLSHAHELDALFTITYKPGQEIFAYLADIQKQMKRVNDMNHVLKEEDPIHIPDTFVRAKLMMAMSVNPMYKFLLDKWLIVEPDQWKELTTDAIYRQLQFVTANNRDVRTYQVNTPQVRDTAVANLAQASGGSISKPKGICFEFAKTGACKKSACNFSHAQQEKKNNFDKPQGKPRNVVKASKPGAPQPAQPKKQCENCGVPNHERKDCKWRGTCNYCGKENHKEAMCRDKKGRETQGPSSPRV
jgi:hypothetical protein